MRNCSVERFIPNLAAAPFGPETTRRVCFKVARICARSASSKVWLATPSWLGVRCDPSDRIAELGTQNPSTQSRRFPRRFAVHGRCPASLTGKEHSQSSKRCSQFVCSCGGRTKFLEILNLRLKRMMASLDSSSIRAGNGMAKGVAPRHSHKSRLRFTVFLPRDLLAPTDTFARL